MTLVSVLVPAYNAADHLELAVRSALVQEGAEIEVIVIDDASIDATWEIVRGLQEGDGRVRAIRFDENRGPAAARNAGIDVARGEWIALLDSDDYWQPGRLDYLLRLAAADTQSDRTGRPGGPGGAAHVDVVCDDVLRVNHKTAISHTMQAWVGWVAEEGHILQAHELCTYDFIPKPMVRASFLSEHNLRYREDLRWGEDFDLCLGLLLRGARWVVGHRAFYTYVQRPGSLVTSPQSLTALVANTRVLLNDPQVRSDPRLHEALQERLAGALWAEWKTSLARAVRSRFWIRAARLLAGSPQYWPRLLSEQMHELVNPRVKER